MAAKVYLDTTIFRREAMLSGRRVKLADAIHAITARQSGCQFVFTADKRFYAPTPLSVAGSDKSGVAKVKSALSA